MLIQVLFCMLDNLLCVHVYVLLLLASVDVPILVVQAVVSGAQVKRGCCIQLTLSGHSYSVSVNDHSGQ